MTDNINNLTVPAAAESISHRYGATLVTQGFQLVTSIFTAGIVPRALGPAVYGNYNFLLTTAGTIHSFLEPSAQQAFFTFSSQDQRSGPMTKLYAVTLFVQLGLIFGIIGLAVATGFITWLWPGQKLDQIILITVLEWMIFVTLTLRQLGDSKGLTIRAQAITGVTAFVTMMTLVLLYITGWLNFYSLVFLNLFSTLLSGIVLVHWLLVINHAVCWSGELRGRIRGYVARWWRFAAPLIVLEYYSPIVAYLSIYLIQRWYGSLEQGYFSLAFRWSQVVLVFTSSALAIVWREIANALASGDRQRAARVYLLFSSLLQFAALLLCTWLSFGSQILVGLLAGEEYRLAVPVLAIMAFYPLQQTSGQLVTAAFKASERTRIYRNLGIFFSVIDLALIYILLAPTDAAIPGLGLGALGVAIRMVGYGLLSVQVYEWACLKFFGASYLTSAVQKILTFTVIGMSGFLLLGRFNAFMIDDLNINNYFSFTVASFMYFIAVLGLVLIWPRLAGLQKEDITTGWQAVKSIALRVTDRYR